jgi:hypothetical protein
MQSFERSAGSAGGADPDSETAWVREHLDEVQRLRSERGLPLLDPADPKSKARYGLEPWRLGGVGGMAAS